MVTTIRGAWRYLAAKAAGRTGIKFVGIDALPQEGVAYVSEFSMRRFNIQPAARKPSKRR